jgi:hypothetical protein
MNVPRRQLGLLVSGLTLGFYEAFSIRGTRAVLAL